jgi:hypothetical protein
MTVQREDRSVGAVEMQTEVVPAQQAPQEESPAPAWVVNRGDGVWGVTWDVPGAVRYEVYQAATLEEATLAEQGPVTSGAAPDQLSISGNEPGIMEYVVVAYGPGEGLPLAVSGLGTGDPDAKADMLAWLKTWKTWRQLSPYQKDKTVNGPATVSYPNGVRRSERSRQIVRNPENAVTFNPNENMCFPGAIVQGALALSNGWLTSAQISDECRASLGISLNRVSPQKETVNPPTKSNVVAAIGRIVNEESPSSTSPVFDKTEAHTSVEAALQLGVSAKYGGVAGSLNVEANRMENQNTVVAYIKDTAFSVQCDVSDANSLFTDKFTNKVVQNLVDHGYMGPTNPPLLVTSVIYGSVLMFSSTSSGSETEIKAALEASYNGWVVNIDATLKARYKQILQNSKVTIAANFIEPDQMKSLLEHGTVKGEYFKTRKYKSYGIIGYVLHTLDNVPAKISESDNFTAVSYDYGTTLTISEFESGDQKYKDFEITIDGKKIKVTPDQPAVVVKPWFPEDKNAQEVTSFDISSMKYGSGSSSVVFDPKSNCNFHPKDQAWTSNGRLASGTSTVSFSRILDARIPWTLTRSPIIS